VLEIIAAPLLAEIERSWLDEYRHALDGVHGALLEITVRATLL
jgi:hypothetical protein